jgi:hypothetical protein
MCRTGLSEVVVITAAMDAWCHHVTRRRAAGIEVVLRQTFADDVSVRHHTDETVALTFMEDLGDSGA